MANLFISYDRTSKPLVLTLVADLEDLGHTVWFDDDLSGGQEWWDHILAKIRGCEIFLFALAPRAIKSVACTREFDYAGALGKPIIPVLVKKGVPFDLLPEALSRIQHVDFLNPKDRKALAAVGRALTTVSSSTSLPDPLPEPPEMPVSYVADLAKRARESTLSSEAQSLLLTDIETSLEDKAFVKDVREILRELKKRSDLLPDTGKGIADLLRRSRPGPPPGLVVFALLLVLGASWLVWDGYFAERRFLPLTVSVIPENAIVTLSGNGLSDETAYLRGMPLAEGNYDIAIHLEGYGDLDETIELGDTTEFVFELEFEKLEEPFPIPELVEIPAGSFWMGSETGFDIERPVHEVSIQSFRLSRYEVTFEQYDAFAEALGNLPRDSGWGRGNRPVIYVSWNDFQDYIQWLNVQTDGAYRLPSEAEWEYAARAGTGTEYIWGDEIGNNQANCTACGSEWDGDQTAPVGSFEPNAFGLYDMHGNVWEWVQDCYEGNYENAPSDGSAYEGGDCRNRVLRGGSWYNGSRTLRSSYRGLGGPAIRADRNGFRLAQDL